MEPRLRKRGGLIGAGPGAQAIVLIAGVSLTALLIALTSLIVRDVIRQLPAAEDASSSRVEQTPPETNFPRRPSAVRSGASSPAEWITSEDYPLDAIRAGLQGTVSIRLDISSAGDPVCLPNNEIERTCSAGRRDL